MDSLDRDGLVDLVKRIRNGEGSDKEFHNWLQEIKHSVMHPEVFNVIIRNTEGLNAEEIVDELMNFRAVRVPSL
ncbi:hypothetical protein [Acetivibrio cellulolyticus]|uniref:hypothetical protein n=1 Tax=Acetivibrio cellulolyticus TaxID=35830 RepID=UPI0001E2F5A2|nr:hypothetical protein [Acetivibrio cellulolyticus]